MRSKTTRTHPPVWHTVHTTWNTGATLLWSAYAQATAPVLTIAQCTPWYLNPVPWRIVIFSSGKIPSHQIPWYLNPVPWSTVFFLSRKIPSRKIPWYLNTVPCNLVKYQSRPKYPVHPVMVQPRPVPSRAIKTPYYPVPRNPGISRSRGIPSRDKNSVPRKSQVFSTL